MASLVHVANAERMMVSAMVQEKGIEVCFADGAKALIPFKDVPEIESGAHLASLELPNPYEMLLRTQRGEEIDIGWDFVRHYADPAYQGRAEKLAATAMRSLGGRIRQFRETSGWTQEHLAEKAGIARVTLSRIENGEQSPRYENLQAISKALGVPFIELVTQG